MSSSFAGRTFRPFKVGLNAVGGKGGTTRTRIQTGGAAKKLIAGNRTPALPLPPTPTSKRIVARQRQSFGTKKYK